MRSLLLAAFALLAAGCPNTDTAVFVLPTLESPSVHVTSGMLVTTIDGSFALKLHLGARASGASTVSLQTFSIVDGSHQSIVDPLKVSASPMPPVVVQPDSDSTIAFTISANDNMLAKDVAAKLCAGQVTIAGAIQDSLENTATPLDSAPFSVTGCP